MLFYTPVENFSGIETVIEVFSNDISNTVVSKYFSRDGKTNKNLPRKIDITDLSEEILTANPGLANAVANDGIDDAVTIQAVLNWLAAQGSQKNTENTVIYIPEGTFDLAKTLNVKTSNITFQGSGTGQTILQNDNTFEVGLTGLPDGDVNLEAINRDAYLFDLNKVENVLFTSLTFTGPDIYGAIFGYQSHGLTIQDSEFSDFLWSSVRLFSVNDAKIYDNVFVDAGGQANGDSGVTGGSIFATFFRDSEIYNNHISDTKERIGEVYGIKGRKFENTRIHHNTINANFAIELPFENDKFVEIDHNYLNGAISIPKFAGGNVPEDGFTFHIHHNYFTKSYSLEWARNGVEVNHNVFVFDANKDNGNLISNFSSEPAKGPTRFHNNLILNPGRGIVWHEGVYNNFSFYNNKVVVNETITPRVGGLFGFNKDTDFSRVEIKDNVIEVNDISRPLMRNAESYGAVIENNELTNISDINKFDNPITGAPQGPTAPLIFQVGVAGEYTVDGFELQ